MTGKSHAFIGVMTGVAITYYGIATDQPLMAVGMLPAIIGSKFPDIDHHNTKIGRARIRVFEAIKEIAIVCLLASIGVGIVACVFDLLDSLLQVCLVAFFSSALVLFVLSDKFHRIFPFLTKHRGIMHTLLVPVVSLVCCNITNSVVAEAILFGFAAGYISHLIADSLTTDKVPLVWPITEESVGLGLFHTGGLAEYIATGILSILIVLYGVEMSKDENVIVLLFTFLLIPAVEKLLEKIGRFLKRIYKKRKLIIFNPLVIIGVALVTSVLCVCLGDSHLQVYGLGSMFGIVLGVKELYFG